MSNGIRSIFLALTAAFGIALAAMAVLFLLNSRFIDSLPLGMSLFVVLPLVAAIPLVVIGVIAGAIGGNARSHGCWFFSMVLTILVAPVVWVVIHSQVSTLLRGSGGLTFLAAAAGTTVAVAGCFSIAHRLASILFGEERPRWAIPIVLLVLLIVCVPLTSWISARPLTGFDQDKPPTIVICTDGASWELINELSAEGDLPAFDRLREEGTAFELKPIPPLMSPILWTTIASGVSAEKHGVHTFYANSASVKVPRIWDVAEQNNSTVGVLGWPVTWPPREINGFMIPSLFARGSETYPEDLRFIRELAMREKGQRSRDIKSYLVYGVRLIQYGVRLTTIREAVRVMTMGGDHLDTMAPKRFLKLRIHGDMFIELLDRYKPGLATFYNNAPDVISHNYWKYYEPEAFDDVSVEDAARFGHLVPQSYREFDSVIGDFLHYIPEYANVVTVSDHGLQATETQAGGTIRLIRTETFLEQLEIDKIIGGINLASRVFLRPIREGASLPAGFGDMIAEITLADSGEKVFTTRTDDSGNLIVEVRRDVEIDGGMLVVPGGRRIAADLVIQETGAKVSGEHNLDAILIIRGEKVRRGGQGGDASILDIAPTVLYLAGWPADEAMEGSVLEAAFLDGWVRNNPPQMKSYEAAATPAAVDSESGGDENIKATLRSLGYLN